MSTANMSRTEALANIRKLQQDAEDLEKQYNEKMLQIMKQISEAASSYGSLDDAQPSRLSPKLKAEKKNATKNATKKKKNVASGERNYSNQMSLKQAIWDVLDRSHKDWAKLLDELPDGAQGLQISEIKEIIEKEQKWVSSSEDISTQLSSHLTNLKKDGFIARAEGGRYYIVKGAVLPETKRGRKPAVAA
jgi:hypothetical protein